MADAKKQLKELMEDNNVDCEIVGLHDLLYQAIIFENVEDEKEIHHSLT